MKGRFIANPVVLLDSSKWKDSQSSVEPYNSLTLQQLHSLCWMNCYWNIYDHQVVFRNKYPETTQATRNKQQTTTKNKQQRTQQQTTRSNTTINPKSPTICNPCLELYLLQPSDIFLQLEVFLLVDRYILQTACLLHQLKWFTKESMWKGSLATGHSPAT